MRMLTIGVLVLAAMSLALEACASPPRDPTRPPGPAEVSAFFGNTTEPARQAGWQLQSVLLADDRRMAIINGRRVSEGQMIDQARVVSIEPGRVVLRQGDQTINLTIAGRAAANGAKR